MPGAISHEPWHIIGPSIDIWFDVPGDIVWARNYRGRATIPLCGGNTITIRDLGKRNIKLAVQINPGSLRNTRKEAFIALAEQSAQFALIPPGSAPVTCKFDPAVAFEERWQNGRRLLTMGFQEVNTITDSSLVPQSPPPGMPPFTLWTNPNGTIILTGQTEPFPVTVSWGGHVHFSIPSAIWITDLAHTIFYDVGLIITKTVAGSMVYSISTATPPAGTYQFMLGPITPGEYTPAYSSNIIIVR
jgi:hypothetical protein